MWDYYRPYLPTHNLSAGFWANPKSHFPTSQLYVTEDPYDALQLAQFDGQSVRIRTTIRYSGTLLWGHTDKVTDPFNFSSNLKIKTTFESAKSDVLMKDTLMITNTVMTWGGKSHKDIILCQSKAKALARWLTHLSFLQPLKIRPLY